MVRAYGHELPSTSGSRVVTQNNAFWPLRADAIAVRFDEALLAR